MTRRSRWFAAVLLLFVSSMAGSPRLAGRQLPSQTTAHVIVKLKAAVAATADREARRGLPARVQAFVDRHHLGGIRAVHEERAGRRLAVGGSDADLAAAAARRFPVRAARRADAIRPPDLSRTYRLDATVGSPAELLTVLAALRADPDVEYAEEDGVARIDLAPNDPYYASTGSWGQTYDDLYGLKKMNLPGAWDATAGEGVTVAVIDTGIDYNHPDLAANVWSNTAEVPGNGIDDDGNGFVDDVRGWDFVGTRYTYPAPDADPRDGHGHGTHVAGTIAAVGNNGIGVVGVAWQAKVMAVKGLDDGGSAEWSQLANAIVYAADNGADVINASWGGSGTSQTIADAVNYAVSLGVVFVASAGNSAADARTSCPANLGNVITVAASDASDKLAYFSNFGPKVDVAAPGVDILSLRAQGTSMGTPLGTDYTRASGTSMAAPHVSGLAALVLAYHPTYTPEQVRQAIRVSAVDIGAAGVDNEFGYGRIDATGAVTLGSVLEVAIQGPADSARVTGPTAITGLARGDGFVRFELSYGAGSLPTSWTAFAGGTTPVVGGTLGVLDTGTMADGLYTLRLTAFDESGRAFVDRRQIVVDWVAITSPAPPSTPNFATILKPGASLQIEGTATGPSFVSFRFEWARGINPTGGWSSVGVSLEGGGTTPVAGSSVATWDTSGVTQADFYTLRLVVQNATFASDARSLVYLEPDLQSVHWPRQMQRGAWPEVGGQAARGPAGERLIMVTSPQTNGLSLWRFSPDGSSAERTDDIVNTSSSIFQSAVGDLDGVPGDEIILAHANFLRIIRADRSTFSIPALPYYGFARAVVVMEDLDGDGDRELLAVGTNFPAGTGMVTAYRADGTPVGGSFPVAIADANQDISNSGVQRLVVADVDGDGAKEVVVAEGPTSSSFSLRLLAADGSPKPWTATTYPGGLQRLAAADLDGDGTSEIVFVQNNSATRAVHVLAADGTERAGWPRAIANGEDGLAIADLDRDGFDEIVTPGAYSLYVFRHDGQAFSASWPRSTSGYYFGAPVAADVNDDGLPEIVVPVERNASAPAPLFPLAATASLGAAAGPGRSSAGAQAQGTVSYYDHRLLVLGRDGAILRSWQLLGANNQEMAGRGTPVVTDVDGDGLTDIVFTTMTAPPGVNWLQDGLLTVLSTGTAYRPDANDWPSDHHDARNSGVLPARGADVTPPRLRIASPPSGSLLSSPATVVVEASDDRAVARVELWADGALVATDDEAPYEFPLDAADIGDGSHQLTAKAYDAAGNIGLSDPYTLDVEMAPVVTITAPAPGATVAADVIISADAVDKGGVARVEFYCNGSLIATDTAAPWTATWSAATVADGSYSLTARAYDARGNVGLADAVAVGVAHAPSVGIASPANGTVVATTTPIVVQASDGGGISRVELVVDGAVAGEDLAAPYAFDWNPAPYSDGPHSLAARAYDAAGHVATSSSVAVVVAIPPSVSLSAPVNGQVLTGATSLSASATDNTAVTRVEFYGNGALLGTAQSAPWSVTWNAATAADGPLAVTARAYDAAGNSATGGPVSVTISIPPTASITAPAAGAVLSGTAQVTADASDNQAVARVELFVDGSLAGSDTSSPFQFELPTTSYPFGAHSLSVTAYDAAGNAASSAPVSVVFDNREASYDAGLRAPKCGAPGAGCDSGALLNGRATRGPEPNYPNTIGNSCSDGTSGTYHVDESNDRLRVSTLDGTVLAAGKMVRVEASVWASSGYSSDKLDLYYAANAQSPSWVRIGTYTPSGPGAGTITATYALPAGGLQAVRANFRYKGSASACSKGSRDDHDDLVFAVVAR